MTGLALASLVILATVTYSPLLAAGFVYEDRNPAAEWDPREALDNRGPWQGWPAERGQFLWVAPRLL